MAKLIYGTESYNLPDDYTAAQFKTEVEKTGGGAVRSFPTSNGGTVLVHLGAAALSYVDKPGGMVHGIR